MADVKVNHWIGGLCFSPNTMFTWFQLLCWMVAKVTTCWIDMPFFSSSSHINLFTATTMLWISWIPNLIRGLCCNSSHTLCGVHNLTAMIVTTLHVRDLLTTVGTAHPNDVRWDTQTDWQQWNNPHKDPIAKVSIITIWIDGYVCHQLGDRSAGCLFFCDLYTWAIIYCQILYLLHLCNSMCFEFYICKYTGTLTKYIHIFMYFVVSINEYYV